MKLEIKKIAAVAAVLAMFWSPNSSAWAADQKLINGAGSTFVYPAMIKWFSEYSKVDPSVNFNYQSIGSGGGIKQIAAQTVDFGAAFFQAFPLSLYTQFTLKILPFGLS